jgi:hypothetical protein
LPAVSIKPHEPDDPTHSWGASLSEIFITYETTVLILIRNARHLSLQRYLIYTASWMPWSHRYRPQRQTFERNARFEIITRSVSTIGHRLC